MAAAASPDATVIGELDESVVACLCTSSVTDRRPWITSWLAVALALPDRRAST
ncbi:hypothetical protein [Nocardia xishanensis]